MFFYRNDDENVTVNDATKVPKAIPSKLTFLDILFSRF